MKNVVSSAYSAVVSSVYSAVVPSKLNGTEFSGAPLSVILKPEILPCSFKLFFLKSP